MQSTNWNKSARCLLKASMGLDFVVYLELSTSQRPLSKRGSENKIGWRGGGWLQQAPGGPPARKIACFGTGVCLQKDSDRGGCGTMGYHTVRFGALDHDVISHLRSGFNNAADLQRAAAVKAAHKPSARELTKLPHNLPRQRKSKYTNQIGPLGTSSIIVCKCWRWIAVWQRLQSGWTSQVD